MMNSQSFYPIGIPSTPWGPAERAQWFAGLVHQRSYATDVVAAIERLRQRFEISQYGSVEVAADAYPLFALRSLDWRDGLPCVLVTGGVHGDETSGVHGALRFAD